MPRWLVNDNESHLVAQVKKLRRRLVVRASDGIHTILLEHLQTPLHRTERQGCAQTGIVLVQAEAFELQLLAIQQETPVAGERHGTNAERGLANVKQLLAVIQLWRPLTTLKLQKTSVPNMPQFILMAKLTMTKSNLITKSKKVLFLRKMDFYY